MKKIMLITILGLYVINGFSQIDSITNEYSKKLFIGIGGSYSSFQDVRYSNVQYKGIGANIEIGYNKRKEHYTWETALNFNYSNENPSTHSQGKTLVLNPNVYFKYLRRLNESFFVGGRVDLFDLYYRRTEGLGNNSDYFINGHHLYGSLIYNKKINEDWHIQSTLDLGLLSFMKESTSFGFSAPQKPLEEGEFSYQNNKLSSPFGYKYFELKHIGSNLNVKMSFMLQYKERLSFGYKWGIRHFANTKSYPVTTGIHNVVIRYNIINK